MKLFHKMSCDIKNQNNKMALGLRSFTAEKTSILYREYCLSREMATYQAWIFSNIYVIYVCYLLFFPEKLVFHQVNLKKVH